VFIEKEDLFYQEQIF